MDARSTTVMVDNKGIFLPSESNMWEPELRVN